MGNCTSKKSSKLPKFTLIKKSTMDKEQIAAKVETRGLSTKIAPCSRGEATSFGFKRRPASALPMPVTLTSRVSGMRQDAGSGSSVESLCHVAPSNTAAVVTNQSTPVPSPGNKKNNPGSAGINRFGFRSSTPTRGISQASSEFRANKSPGTRSKSAGPKEAREAFFRPLMQQAGSANSVLNASRLQMSESPNPSQFTLKTSQLPRPQYPVRLSDKVVKTVTNYCRRDGPNDSGASKEVPITQDSEVSSSSGNTGETDTLHALELSNSSAASSLRGPIHGPRKFEMRVVNGYKFELIDKNENGLNGTKMVQPRRSSVSTGLVQQRTEQYLQRIAGVNDSNRFKISVNKSQSTATSPLGGAESEEEKLKKDANKSEKCSGVTYLMSEGGENDELLPGEAMAEDISVSFSSDEDFSSVDRPNRMTLPSNTAVGSVIRVDALKVSSQLKKTKTPTMAQLVKDDSSCRLFNAEERSALDEDTLLDLSSESDVSGDKDSAMEKITQDLNGSTGSNDTPSNASLSEGRDFLIDDEIADQPQLCFSTHEEVNFLGSGNNNGSEGTVLATSQGIAKEEKMLGRTREVRRSSVGTLSPCESLLSDDLMMDFDTSATEENPERCERNALNDLEATILRDEVRKCWSTLPRISQGSNGRLNGRANSENCSPTSNRSGVSRASTDEDLSVRVDKSTYQLMFQDIVSIKGMLLKLNRLLSESEGNITPFQEEDVTMDLKKQVAFLQQQLQQRETTLQNLQAEINKNINHQTQSETRTLCNAATQTDRVRPVSTGPSLLQNLPSDSNIVTNGRSRKSSENLEEGSRLRLAPAETILEKVKALSFKPVEVVERRPSNCKNVFKITKIDLVLKSDNYGQSELRKS